ncbi:MFS transporter [Streptomyces sp. NPDC048111]|uniref:MFS transporter n=1 Tax=Streptomyces sp. NPDC048111 TaxID=3365500 RepID=UPI0037172606
MATPLTTGRPANPRAALYALCAGFFMICLDATVVNVAAPDIRARLGASLNEAVWVNSSYALCYAVPLILSGRLGDLYGPRRIFLTGLAGFTAASAACALAPGPPELIIARALQGLAAALIAPQTMSMIVHLFPVQHRSTALGVWAAVGGAAMAAGPVIGGLLITWSGWRGIFLVNIPVGILGWAAAVQLLPRWRPARPHRLDLWGIALSSLGLTALIFGLVSGEAYNWGTVAGIVTIPSLLAFGFLSLAAFIWWQYRNSREPLLPLQLFRHRDFSAVSIAGGAVGAAMGGFFLPLMLYLQSDLGHSPLEAGAATVPMFVLSSLCARRAGRWSDTRSPRTVAASGFALLIAGTATLDWLLHPGITLGALMPSLLLVGAGIGLASAPLGPVRPIM